MMKINKKITQPKGIPQAHIHTNPHQSIYNIQSQQSTPSFYNPHATNKQIYTKPLPPLPHIHKHTLQHPATRPGGGGHSHWKVIWGRAALKTPFFRSNFSSGDPPFQAFFPLQSLHLDFLKNLAFQVQFLPIFISRDTNFSKNQFRKPYF